MQVQPATPSLTLRVSRSRRIAQVLRPKSTKSATPSLTLRVGIAVGSPRYYDRNAFDLPFPSRSGREALPKANNNRGPLEPNLPAQQRPQQAAFLPQEAEPRSLSAVTCRSAVPTCPSSTRIVLSRITTVASAGSCPGEREVVGAASPADRAAGRRAAPPGSRDRSGPKAVADGLGLLVREPLRRVVLGIGARHDVDRFLLLLQRVDDCLQKPLRSVKERPDHVLAGRADRHAVGGLVVRPEARLCHIEAVSSR